MSSVQEMLGHSSIVTTCRYIHPDMQEKIKVSTTISDLLNNTQEIIQKVWEK